jgi:cytochrome P450
MVKSGAATWSEVFDEYVRWISPIGMSPREVAKDEVIGEVQFTKGERIFFMFSSAGHDEAYFEAPETFDIKRNTGPSIPFGAGPHFCGGAAVARSLITDVALPKLFKACPNLRLAGPAPFTGWAFRGPTKMPVAW